MTIAGIDTSNHNHPGGAAINWPAVAASGVRFGILKATEGIGFIDPYLARDRAGAHSAGLLVGLYHFARSGDPAAQARYFLSAIGSLQVGEFVVVDDEDPAITPAWVKTFCDTIYAATTVKPLVYINQSYQNTQNWSGVVANNDGEWLAKYDGSTAQPSGGPWSAPAMKQYTSTGTAAGIVGPVDLDVFYGTDQQLLAYGLGGNPGGSTIVLDNATATQISQIVVNALQTPLIDWSGTPNGNQSVLNQLKLNAEGLAAILAAVNALPAGQALDPQAVADAIVAKLPAAQAQQVADLVLAGIAAKMNTPTAPQA